MADPVAIFGVVLGGAGCVASAASAVYFRSQARAAHRQAAEAQRQSESAMDTMQDVYFLRKDGCVTDQYWHVWTKTFFRFYAKMPTFLQVFEFAADEGLVHPEFVAFFRSAIDGETLPDPARAGLATS